MFLFAGMCSAALEACAFLSVCLVVGCALKTLWGDGQSVPAQEPGSRASSLKKWRSFTYVMYACCMFYVIRFHACLSLTSFGRCSPMLGVERGLGGVH